MIRRALEAVGAATVAVGAFYAYARVKPHLPDAVDARTVWERERDRLERARLGPCLLKAGAPDRRPDAIVVPSGATTACYLDWTCSCGRTHRFYHDTEADNAPSVTGSVAIPGAEVGDR